MKFAAVSLILLLGLAGANADDRVELLEIHQQVLAAHLASDVDALLADMSEDFTSVNRGAMTEPGLGAMKERLGPYLAATRFTVYRDRIPPKVSVSDDGTLGWVIAEVEAEGMQETESGTRPVRFQSAWIELYEKRDGRWLQVGNVSNFKPE